MAPTTNSRAIKRTWAELPKDFPMPLLERRRVIGERMMISEVLLKPGCLVPVHSHMNEQFTCILRGRLRFTFGDSGQEPITVGPGEVLVLPAHVPHGAEALEETLLLDLFSPPSATTGIDRPGPHSG